VSEVVRLVQPDARHSSVEIVLGLADGLAPVLADNIQIQQVLVNLVRNAIEAISAAVSPVREVRITTRPGRDAMIEIAVEDSGPGFDATTAARLFEPFFTTKAEGMGIGLSISRSIVAAHGGRIHAEPRAGGGARFVLALPPAPQP
jgi:two-component system sensor kinase FixL